MTSPTHYIQPPNLLDRETCLLYQRAVITSLTKEVRRLETELNKDTKRAIIHELEMVVAKNKRLKTENHTLLMEVQKLRKENKGNQDASDTDNLTNNQ